MKFIFFILILCLYLSLTLPLLNNEPPPFPDETFFASFATPNPIDQKSGPTFYGPLFFLCLSVPVKIFGFSLLSVKITPILIGIFCLIASYFLGKSLLLPLLLATDPFFLEATRTVRPEILCLLWIILSLYFYLKTKKTFFSGLFAGLAFLTQSYLGIIPILVISIHLILKKSKKLFIFLAPVILLSTIWLIYLLNQKDSFATVLPFIKTRVSPSFYSLKSILLANLITKSLSLLYVLTIIISKKTFLILNFLITSAIVLYGSASWYLAILIIPPYLALVSMKNRKFFAVIFIAFISLNIFYQSLLIHYYKIDNYKSFSLKISDELPPNANVILGNLTPDPYFYLVEKRPDLKIFWPNLLDHPQSYDPYFQKANYLVIPLTDYINRNIGASRDSPANSYRAYLFKFLNGKNLKPIIIPEPRYGGVAIIKL